jgi:fatty acid desaturase
MRYLKDLEWPTVSMLALAYGLWAFAGFVLFPSMPVLAIGLMAVAAALHASLQHEALHGHPTRNAGFNEFLVSLPLGVFYPYRRFKQMHLCHHDDERLTDPYDDPESWYRSAANYGRMAAPLRWLLAINNSMAGRVAFGPALMVIAFLASEPGRLWRGERGVRQAWLNHAAGLAVLVFTVHGLMGIHIALYAVTVAYGGLSIIAIRTYCEHRWADDPDGRTVIVERGGIFGLLFLNNNLHLVHHKQPRAAWYDLPAIYASERDAWRRRNGGYVFSSYWEIARNFGFRIKEPVVHPVWRRDEAASAVTGPIAAGATIQPVAPALGPQIGCNAVVPAKPDQG